MVEAPSWPEGALYHSEWGVFPFQADQTAQAYVWTDRRDANGAANVVWDTGLGKSHLAMLLSALLTEDSASDIMLVVAEKAKIGEWVEDFAKFTRLTARLHHGGSRMKAVESDGLPQVLVSTYETFKTDLCKFIKPPGKRGTVPSNGPLLDRLLDKRVLVVFDEITKLKNRGSGNHKAFDYAINKVLRKQRGCRAIGLTATPLETGLEDYFNILRLLNPTGVPLVKDFESRYVRWRDPYGRPTYHRDLIPEFHRLYVAPVQLRKRKTDPDVIDQFPKMTEQGHNLELPPETAKFYEFVEGLGWPEDDEDEDFEPPPGLWTTLRLVAGYPEALTLAGGELSRTLTREMGADALKAMPAAKMDWLLEQAGTVVAGQGAKMVVFTFFGQAILPLIARDLRNCKHKFRVFTNHGGMTPADQTAQRMGFREYEEPCIFVSSDAGARGLNLPEATYLTNYDAPLTHSLYVQRSNRISRIVGGKDKIATVDTLVVRDTVEQDIALHMNDRNEDHDAAVGDDGYGDENFITAAERKQMLGIRRRTKKKKGKAA